MTHEHIRQQQYRARRAVKLANANRMEETLRHAFMILSDRRRLLDRDDEVRDLHMQIMITLAPLAGNDAQKARPRLCEWRASI